MRREWKTGKAKRQKQTLGKSSVPGSAKATRMFNLEADAGVKKRKSGGGGHAVSVERPHKSGFPRRQVKAVSTVNGLGKVGSEAAILLPASEKAWNGRKGA